MRAPPKSAIEAGIAAVIKGRQIESGLSFYVLASPDDSQSLVGTGPTRGASHDDRIHGREKEAA